MQLYVNALWFANLDSIEQYLFYRYVNTRIMTAAMNPKPEKLRRGVILKFKNLQVTARTMKDELVPFVLGWINLIEIHVKYIFRSLKKKSIACFGAVSKIGKYKEYYKICFKTPSFSFRPKLSIKIGDIS